MTTAGAITDPVLTPAVPAIILYAVGEPTWRPRALIPWEYANSRASLGSPTVSKPVVKPLLGIRAGPLCRPSREDSDWDELSVARELKPDIRFTFVSAARPKSSRLQDCRSGNLSVTCRITCRLLK
jgi:hypothetical protein